MSRATNLYTSKKLLAIVLGIVILGGIVVGVTRHSPHKKTAQSGTDKVITHSTDNPAETPITKDNFVWTGAATSPKYISLPSIHAGGFLQQVGVDQNQAVGVPTNINLGGWFTKSVSPGAKGLSVIDGHIDGKTKPGIFINLGKLKNGQVFSVEFGNGTKKKFTVTSVTTVSAANAPAALFSQDPSATSQLNLITCGGTFNRTIHHYEDRIIVTSVLVS